MSLAPGQRLGPYEVVGAIGAGGMGEVYKARDTRLHREVALKVLPADISTDPTRRKRFEQEARAVAALSHPHICAIHDIGAEGQLDYLVLELVDGETLAARLKRGPMPVDEALVRAREIADAVASAHRRGIVHRDLKPANIMLTKTGAKVLDFGLAKIVRDEAQALLSAAPTATTPLTDAGMVIGTLQYMAPEQVEGRPADARTDVFAFGTVLYEMLTGKRAFEGSSAAGLMGAILRADAPSVASMKPELPDSLDRLIRACLVKDPDDRIASMHDVAVALGWVQQDLARPHRMVAAASAPRRRSPAWLVMIATCAVAVAAAYMLGRRPGPSAAPSRSYVYDIQLPSQLRNYAGLALSPDGRRLALVTQPPPGAPIDPRLWIRDLDSAADWQLVSAGGEKIPRAPFWSPDGRSLGFFVRGRLVRVDLPALVPLEICAAADGRGAAWLDDGTIVFAPTASSGLMRVDAKGGTPSELVKLQEGEVGLKFPSDVGGGRMIYWAQNSNPVKSELRLIRINDPGHATPIVETTAAGVYDNGTLFYLRAGLWVGESFDLATARLSGDARPVSMDGPAAGANVGQAILSAAFGSVAVANVSRALVQATWIDRAGKTLGRLGEPEAQVEPAVSADGRRVAVAATSAGEGTLDLWLLDVETGARRRLTTGADARSPMWNGDSQRIAFRSLKGTGGNGNLYEIDADDSQSWKPLLERTMSMWPVGWLPGNRLMFFTQALPTPNLPLPRGILIREGDGTSVTPFRTVEAEIRNARLSPDGARITYLTDGPSGADLFVDGVTTPRPHPIHVAHGAIAEPQWRADSRELFFVDANRLMAASVPVGPEVTVGTPARILDMPSTSYAVDPKTGRFLVMVPISAPSHSVRVTLNWTRR